MDLSITPSFSRAGRRASLNSGVRNFVRQAQQVGKAQQELDQRRAAAKGDDAEYRSLVPSTDKNAHQHNVDRGREFSMSSSPRDTPAWTLASDKSSSIAKRPVATVKLLHWQNMDEEKDAEAAETKSEGKADEDISQSPASKIRPRLSATFRSVSRQKLDQLERKEQHNPPVGHYRPRFTVVERPPRPVSILRGERFVDLAAQASEREVRPRPASSLGLSRPPRPATPTEVTALTGTLGSTVKAESESATEKPQKLSFAFMAVGRETKLTGHWAPSKALENDIGFTSPRSLDVLAKVKGLAPFDLSEDRIDAIERQLRRTVPMNDLDYNPNPNAHGGGRAVGFGKTSGRDADPVLLQQYKVWQRTYGPKARSAPCVVYPLPHETLSRCRDRRTRGFNLKKSVGRRPPGAPTIGNNLVYEKALAAHDATRPRTHTPIAFRKTVKDGTKTPDIMEYQQLVAYDTHACEKMCAPRPPSAPDFGKMTDRPAASKESITAGMSYEPSISLTHAKAKGPPDMHKMLARKSAARTMPRYTDKFYDHGASVVHIHHKETAQFSKLLGRDALNRPRSAPGGKVMDLVYDYEKCDPMVRPRSPAWGLAKALGRKQQVTVSTEAVYAPKDDLIRPRSPAAFI